MVAAVVNADLYARLESLSKALESSGRIDEHDYPKAYATILDVMNVVAHGLPAKRRPLVTAPTGGAMKAHVLARHLMKQPNDPTLFTNGSGTIFRAGEPYREDDDGAVWVDLEPV